MHSETRESPGRPRGLVPDSKPNGAAAAALLSTSFGIFLIGLLTTLAAAIHSVSSWLVWSSAVGSLSGKTTLGLIVWIVSWLGAHYLLRGKETNLMRFVYIAAVLVVVGLVLTFPLFFELFE